MMPVILAMVLVAAIPAASLAGETPQTPYSCQLLYDEQRKCGFGACDKRALERLRRECLRDGGRP